MIEEERGDGVQHGAVLAVRGEDLPEAARGQRPRALPEATNEQEARVLGVSAEAAGDQGQELHRDVGRAESGESHAQEAAAALLREPGCVLKVDRAQSAAVQQVGLAQEVGALRG